VGQPANSPLDNLPPLTLPADPQRSTPPVAPDANALPRAATELPTSSNTPAPGASTAPAPVAAVNFSATSAKAEPADPAPAPLENAAALSVAPGIKHFQGLEPNLAGGSLPAAAGLDWLLEKGYKTILDLREPGPDQAAFIAEVTKRGLRYLPLPIAVASFDAEHVSRFNAEIDQPDARPLYFFDNEGDRAGAMWYIRRITVEKVKVDAKTAVQEAKALGMSDQHIWLAATGYLDRLSNVAPSGGTAAEAAAVPAGPATIEPPKAPAPETSRPRSAAAAAAVEPASTESPRDPAAWKPLAAMLVTTLGVPLAYWAPSAFSALGGLGRARASLPAPGRSPRSLPGASGE
jgi:protein tyrosine phosphatase (PTP) superfamily phosphohydrolase (DUF442 family)